MRYLIVSVCFLISSEICTSQNIRFSTSDKFITREAVQGVAVGRNHFYTINTRGIGKYDKETGLFVTEWRMTEGKIIHLDGGIVIIDKLYCAHSNYPGIPMMSSIEIFSAEDLNHLGSHGFGAKYGSCTWADYYKNSWWVCFAQYDQFRAATGKGTEGTILVRFDRKWHEKESWTFPSEIITEVRPMSVSGGSWGPDGKLYVTGHDSAEVYILKLPRAGSVLEYSGSARIESRGQGIAWDRTEKNEFYGIVRKENAVVASKLTTGK
ncbi:MAG TPA: hypothetical protein VK155_00585 [Bacteroidales bacterium]|jgi:hypothetical protein|nr:hypothetical protein [Bacteroidales bacterium]